MIIFPKPILRNGKRKEKLESLQSLSAKTDNLESAKSLTAYYFY